MPPSDNQRPKRRARRSKPPKALGLGNVIRGAERATKPVSGPPAPRPQVKTDVQSSGPDYGTRKAKQFKRTATYKRSVAAAKPARKTERAADPQGIAKANRFKAAHVLADEHQHYAGVGPFKVYTHSTYTDPFTGKPSGPPQYIREIKQAKAEDASKVVAPALKVLEQTTRPSHAVAGAVDQALKGKSPLKGAYEGGIKNKPYSFTRVLKDAGAPKIVQKVGGFALDVAADPLTYTTFGTGSVAKRAATKAAADAARKAERAGLSEAGKETVMRAAAKRATSTAKEGAGVTVKFAGREAPGVRRASAKVGRAVKRTPVPKSVKKAGSGAREVARDFRPTLKPSGADEASYVAARQAARSSRSAVTRAQKTAENEARGLKAQIGEDNYATVIDAIEKQQIGKLPEDLRHAAIRLRSVYRHENRLRKRAGIAEGTVTKRAKVKVPKVTANVEQSAKDLAKAQRARASAEVAHRKALKDAGVAHGRAQILSRNVGGRRAEVAAERSKAFAGGAVGVRQANKAVDDSAARVAAARERASLAEAQHAAMKEAAKVQRAARRRAVKAKQARQGEATGYVPHALSQPLKEGAGIVQREADAGTYVGKVRRPGSSLAREDKRPISVQNAERAAASQDTFSTDIPLVHLNYRSSSAKAVQAGELEKGIANAGRTLRPKIVRVEKTLKNGRTKVTHERDFSHVVVKPGEAVYHLGYTGGQKSSLMLREVSPKDWAAGNVPKHGRLVAIDKRVVESARQYGTPTQATSATGRAFDKVTRDFKIIATATPGFHLRNLAGDTQLAYLEQPGYKLPANLYGAYKAVKGINAQRKAAANLAHAAEATGKTIKVSEAAQKTLGLKSRDLSVEDFIKLADKEGVTQSGYLTREIPDLAAKSTLEGVAAKGPVRRVLHEAGRAFSQQPLVRAITQDRENFVRLSTFKDALDRGLPPAKAADVSMSVHIDYADLTELERKYGRRLFPFYTWTARALPLQAKKLVTNPGKFATLEKIREDAGTTNVSGFTEWQQRQVPLVIDGKGITAGLPITLLNEIPTTTSPEEYATELFKFTVGLANPIVKSPVEYLSNYNFQFRDQIQPTTRPLVSAPNWVSIFSDSQRKQLGIVKGIDKRTGRRVWMWPGKTEYKVRAFMLGPLNQFNQLTASGTNRIQQNQGQKVLSALTGVRVQPSDFATAEIGRLYQKLDVLQEKQAALNQQGVKARNATREYRQVTDEMKRLERRIYELSKKRKDKILPTRGAPKKGRGGGGGSAFGGGFGGGFSDGGF